MPSSSGHSSSILSLLPIVRRGGGPEDTDGSALRAVEPPRAGSAPDPALWDQYAAVVAGAMRYAWTWQGRAFPSASEGDAS